MPDLFHFPDLHTDRDQIFMFRTPPPHRTSHDMLQMAKMFGVDGKLRDAGSRFVIRDRRSTLEFFNASDSVWWTHQDNAAEEPSEQVKLPKEPDATKLAQVFLRDRGLHDELAAISSVTYTEASRMDRGQGESGPYQIAQHVNFAYSIDELPIMGPGAKAQVTIGSRSRIIEAYRFWRKPVRDHESRIIPFEEAINIFRHDGAFTYLQEGESRIVIDDAQLAYYALPPREVQGYFIPVYAFTGTVMTPHLKSYEFVKYIVAIRYSPEDVKRYGIVFEELANAF